jgi:aminoglycoside 6-adenylyltransferase
LRTQEEVLKQFHEWAYSHELVRAAVLTSSRANPECETDLLSDYDLEIYVADIEPFETSDAWLRHFGKVMLCWPFKPGSGAPWADITRLVIFEDAVRIDFQIHKAEEAVPTDTYDDGYTVLLDKDGLLSQLEPPTHTKHLVKKPTREQYDTLVHEFWWNAHYVPKSLRRDQLPFAATMLAQSVRSKYLHTAMGWVIGLQNNWAVNVGVHGGRFKRFLDERTWREYEATFAGPAIQEQWRAFYASVDLFERLTRLVGEHLGYEFPEALNRRMRDYCRWIQTADLAAAGGGNLESRCDNAACEDAQD